MTRRPKKQSTRRDFLKGKSAADAVGDLGQSIPAEANEGSSSADGLANSEPQFASRSYLIEVGRRAMACQFDVFLNAGEHAGSTEVAIEALDLVEELECQLSVYRDTSEVSRLNATAFAGPIEVETRLFELIQQSLELHETTQGAFDITSGPLIKAWSRLRNGGVMPTADEISVLLNRVGSGYVALDDSQHSVQFLRQSVTIDFGGIGKGFALDRSAEVLTAGGVDNFMIHGGSSSILARGARQAGTKRDGWTVGIRHPLRADRRLLEVALCDRAIGTSGAGTKQFYHQGKRYGHVIDPRTGTPSEGVLSTTVIAPSAALADALSTAFYVMGPAAAADFCAARADVSALITTEGRHAGSVELHRLNCDDLEVTTVSQ